MCENDLQQLVVSGTALPEELFAIWTNLFLEYCELSEQSETQYRVYMEAKIRFLEIKIKTIQDWVTILKTVHLPGVAEALKDLDFDVVLDPADPEQYASELKYIEAELRPMRIEKTMLQEEVAVFDMGQSSHDTVDRKYFSTIFIRINRYMRYEAVNGQTTVENYCAALRDYVSAFTNNKNID